MSADATLSGAPPAAADQELSPHSGSQQGKVKTGQPAGGDAHAAARAALQDADRFVRLTAAFAPSPDPAAIRRVVIRPVDLKRGRQLQVSTFDAKKDITKNYPPDQARRRLDELWELPFRSLTIQMVDEDLVVERGRNGVRLRRQTPHGGGRAQATAHDASKDAPLALGRSAETDAFLSQIGIADELGRVRPRMHAKFTQINELLTLLEQANVLETLTNRPLRVVDCGCGTARLTLAVAHYLHHTRGVPVKVVGVDRNAELVAKDETIAAAIGALDVTFVPSEIIAYTPEGPPDIVLALHACDTATDEALAQAIRWQAPLIMAAPCCHHQLQTQMATTDTWRPVLRHGLLKERLGDVLTDAFRANILRQHGYATDVVQFVAAEHTPRNLLIRAVRRDLPPDAGLEREYTALKAQWGVTPYLETLLASTP